MSKCKLKDSYNTDEFGLFYQAHPDKSLFYKCERCSGGKYSEEKLTRLTAGNAMGERLTMFLIGMSTNSRCFSGIKSLSCCYCTQKHSWIVRGLFTKWVKEVDRKFSFQDRKIALIIGNCPAHPKVDDRKALELIFLPFNTTSKTQPMDQGIISSLTAYYHYSLIKW